MGEKGSKINEATEGIPRRTEGINIVRSTFLLTRKSCEVVSGSGTGALLTIM